MVLDAIKAEMKPYEKSLKQSRKDLQDAKTNAKAFQRIYCCFMFGSPVYNSNLWIPEKRKQLFEHDYNVDGIHFGWGRSPMAIQVGQTDDLKEAIIRADGAMKTFDNFLKSYKLKWCVGLFWGWRATPCPRTWSEPTAWQLLDFALSWNQTWQFDLFTSVRPCLANWFCCSMADSKLSSRFSNWKGLTCIVEIVRVPCLTTLGINISYSSIWVRDEPVWIHMGKT